MPLDLNPKLFTDLALSLRDQPLQGFPDRFFILDCETTGGRAQRDRMTELAWIEIRAGQIHAHWHSLFNPEMPIPSWIRDITGISSDMVRDAPLFADCADEIAEQLNGQVIVAHNARFDYGFLKNEFRRAEVSFSAKTLCSVKLSRQLYANQRGHGLDAICKRFNIQLEYRHRAMSDVLAVLAFFRHTSQHIEHELITASCQQMLKKPSLPPNLPADELDKLPHAAGVYYMYGSDDELLYVGKSVDIKSRVSSHFIQDHQSATDTKLGRNVAHIDYQRTPADFGAQLLEAQEIKRLSPAYNRRLRRQSGLYQLVLQTDDRGYQHVVIRAVKQQAPDGDCYGLFRSQYQARNRLLKLATEYQLCQQLLGLEAASKGPCFAYQLHQCQGACCGEEAASEFNDRLQQALNTVRYNDWPWQGAILVTETDPLDSDYQEGHLIDQWRYLGRITDQDAIQDVLASGCPDFDLDMYHILVRFLFPSSHQAPSELRIQEIN